MMSLRALRAERRLNEVKAAVEAGAKQSPNNEEIASGCPSTSPLRGSAQDERPRNDMMENL